MNLSICIATYKRAELLRILLDSILNQELTDDLNIEIIVVDNDPDESAKIVFNHYSNTDKFSFYYYTQPLKNISITRNLAVQKAMGEFILFIDDDEYASSNWILLLLGAQQKYDADGVFGAVKSHFNPTTPKWITSQPVFNRITPPTGTEAHHKRTGNCLIKTSLLKSIPGPFSIEYGLTGGEDTHLFAKLRKNGARFINSKEAWVSEFVPPERANTIYLLKRTLRTGNNYTRRILENPSKNNISNRAYIIVVSIFSFFISLFLSMIFVFDNSKRLYWNTKLTSNIGHLLAAMKIFVKGY